MRQKQPNFQNYRKFVIVHAKNIGPEKKQIPIDLQKKPHVQIYGLGSFI